MLVHACCLRFRCILLNRGMPFSLKELSNLSLWCLERCEVVTLLLSFSPVISVVCCQLSSVPLSPEGGSAAGPPCHRHCLWQRWCPDALPDWWRYCLVLGRWRLRQAGQRRQWRLQSAHEGISCLSDLDLPFVPFVPFGVLLRSILFIAEVHWSQGQWGDRDTWCICVHSGKAWNP